MIKIVRESLLEFHQTGDPLNSLNIGISNITEFKNVIEFINYIISMIPSILGTDKIPDDIIKEKGLLMGDEYFKKICRFLNGKTFKIEEREFQIDEDGHTISSNLSSLNIWYTIHDELERLGFESY